MKVVECRTTRFIIRPDNIIESHAREDWDEPDSIETAKETAYALQEIASKGNYAHLSFPPNLYIKKEIVKAYLEVDVKKVAEAIVVKSFGARLLGNLVLQVKKANVPSKLFGDKKEAEEWLLEQLKKVEVTQ